MNNEAERRRRAFTQFMERRGLTRGGVARIADLPPNVIYNFLGGKSRSLSQPTLEKIAQAFNVPVSLLTGMDAREAEILMRSGLAEAEHAVSRPIAGNLPGGIEAVRVTGMVHGPGVWTETLLAEPGDAAVPLSVPAIYGGRMFAVRAAPGAGGPFPDGAVLGCVVCGDYLQPLVSGDAVLVVRRNPLGMFECTIREYLAEGKRHWVVSHPAGDRAELLSPLSDPGALGYQDFFLHAVVLSYFAALPAGRR